MCNGNDIVSIVGSVLRVSVDGKGGFAGCDVDLFAVGASFNEDGLSSGGRSGKSIDGILDLGVLSFSRGFADNKSSTGSSSPAGGQHQAEIEAQGQNVRKHDWKK